MISSTKSKPKLTVAYDAYIANEPHAEANLIKLVLSVANKEAEHFLAKHPETEEIPSHVATTALEKVLAGIKSVTGGGSGFNAWTRVVINHVCIDALKRQEKLRKLRVPMLTVDESGLLDQNPLILSNAASAPLMGVELQQREQELLKPATIPVAITGTRKRELAKLLSEGRSYEEMAAETGDSEGSLRQQKSRLAKEMSDYLKANRKRGCELLNPSKYVVYGPDGQPESRGTKWAGDAAPPWKPGMKTFSDAEFTEAIA